MQSPLETHTQSQNQSQTQHHLRQSLLCMGSGLLSALAFSTHSTGWLVWFSFIPWLYVLFRYQDAHPEASRWALAKGFGFYSWLFGASFYIGIIHWLKELHPLTWLQGVDNATSLLIVYGGIFGISLFVSLWSLLYGLILGALKPQGVMRVVYPAVLWMFMEALQAMGQMSLPWARLAMSQYKNLWLLQIVPHTGQLVIGAVIIALNAALARFVLSFGPDPEPQPYWKYPGFRSGLSVLGVVGLLLAYGASRLSSHPTPAPATDDVQVAVVQGNIPQGQKWSTNEEFWQNVAATFDIYSTQSANALKQSPDQKIDLLIWPESALPVPIRHISMYESALSQITQRTHGYFISGTFDQEVFQKPPMYNAAALFNPSGQLQSWYYKRQLVPFGEFFPYRSTLEAVPGLGVVVKKLNPMNSDIAPGTSPALFETPFGKIGTQICFESVYPEVTRSSVKAGANLLVVITNDGWYRDAIALYQHLGHAVLRSLENERYLARAGNTGISAFIDPYGRILSQSLPLEQTAMVKGLPRAALQNQGLTLYTRYGDWPLVPGFLLLVFGEIWRRRQRPETSPASL
jgi:apolipoprotein N-acyltransferase